VILISTNCIKLYFVSIFGLIVSMLCAKLRNNYEEIPMAVRSEYFEIYSSPPVSHISTNFIVRVLRKL